MHHVKCWLNELQARINIAERNINSLRYADDNTSITESEEELNSLLMRVKEENEKACLKLNIQRTEITTSGPMSSWQTEGEKVKTVTDFIFLGSKITADIVCNHAIKRCFFLRRKIMTNLAAY